MDTDSLEEQIESLLKECHGYTYEYTVPKLATLARQYANEQVKETEKAYGGCHNCYGKGYASFKTDIYGAADFPGDVERWWPGKGYMLCKCDRGTQLGKLFVSIKTARVSGAEKESK